LITASGCSQKSLGNLNLYVSGFSCEFSVLDSDTAGRLEVNDSGDAVFYFESPEGIHGTKFRIDDDKILIENGDFIKKFDRHDIPEYSPAVYTHSALKCAKNFSAILQKDVICINGKCDCGDFEIYFSQTGHPFKIELKDIKNTILLNNVILSNDN
jgi:hypothetical protein